MYNFYSAWYMYGFNLFGNFHISVPSEFQCRAWLTLIYCNAFKNVNFCRDVFSDLEALRTYGRASRCSLFPLHLRVCHALRKRSQAKPYLQAFGWDKYFMLSSHRMNNLILSALYQRVWVAVLSESFIRIYVISMFAQCLGPFQL